MLRLRCAVLFGKRATSLMIEGDEIKAVILMGYAEGTRSLN